MRILAIETSCDETAASIVEEHSGALEVLAHTVSSQAELHARYGGVVPNLAAREHVKSIIPVLEKTLSEATLSSADIDAIAVTQGPGLIPALLIGVSAAKLLALTWEKPLIGINHLEGHIYANFLNSRKDQFPISNFQSNPNDSISKLEDSNIQSKFDIRNSIFPLLALIVSGGHTQLVLMRDHFTYQLLGETEDDAAGEAFDKVAKMLGLPYPGGPEVAKRADAFRTANNKFQISNLKTTLNEQRSKSLASKLKSQESTVSSYQSPAANFSFPRPMLDTADYQFSFSGLKTSVLYFLKKHPEDLSDAGFVAQVCHEFQEAVVDVLVGKTERAIQEYAPRTVVIAGGVSANVRLRQRMETLIRDKYPRTHFRMPPFIYSLDNASMIGAAAAMRLARLHPSELESLKSNALSLEPSASLSLA